MNRAETWLINLNPTIGKLSDEKMLEIENALTKVLKIRA